jgi:hypothetical protein
MLIKKERNELFQIIVEGGLSPGAFSELNKSDLYSILQTNTPFIFHIEPDREYHKLRAFPEIGTPRIVGTTIPKTTVWFEVLEYFRKWITVLKEESDIPDLFADFRTNANLFIGQSSAPDEKFSNLELRELASQLRRIESGLIELRLPAPAQKVLTEVIQEAPDKAVSFTKKEWQSWLIGAVVSQVTNLALSPEHVTAVYQLLKSTFTGLLQLH